MMYSRKSMSSMVLDPAMQTPLSSTSANASPLRRKSMIQQKSVSINLSVNDDEVERLARRREINVMSTPQSTNTDRRRSMGLGRIADMPSPKIAEGINECIKLGAENKINIKNAFSLQMIDFMTHMIKKQNANIYNLQVGSTSLDVSTKIYAFRVDGVHMDILKMAGGSDKRQNAANDDQNEQNNNVPEDGENLLQSQKKKKKKRKANQNIISTQEALRGNVEVACFTSQMSTEIDLQTTDMLFQSSLPNHCNSRYYLHQYNDVIMDTLDDANAWSHNPTEVPLPAVSISSDSVICPSLQEFEFLDWSVEDEPENPPPEDHSSGALQFDLDASLPSDNEPNMSNHFDLNEETEQINMCAPEPNRPTENIVDFRKILTVPGLTKPLEYSYAPKGLNIHWAGPSHWRTRHFLQVNSSLLKTYTHACRQETIKKKKDLVLKFDEFTESIDNKFAPHKSVKIQGKTVKLGWHEKSITLPQDLHYDITETTKFYLQEALVICGSNVEPSEAADLPEDVVNYDYNNENDTSNYCADVANSDFHGNDDHHDDNDCILGSEEDAGFGSQAPFTGSNLVALPKLASKIFIPYSLRAKKIDMRHLKKSIWSCISPNNDKENVNTQEASEPIPEKINESKHFSEIYKKLPNMLSKNNADALSFPIAFVSLLHLANEKTLKVFALQDMSDIIVDKD